MKLPKGLYNYVILIFLFSNLTYITMNYMKFKTNSNVAPYFPARLKIPKTSLCFSLFSMMGKKNERVYSFDKLIPPFINMTFDQVLTTMPKSQDTLTSCKYKDFISGILIEEKDGNKCMEKFKVTRFRMQSYICYTFELLEEKEYSFHSLVNSIHSIRELYHLNLKSPLSNEYIYYPLLHFDKFPDDDRVFNQEATKEKKSKKHLTYDLFESTSLPFPYETNCSKYSKVSCYQKCMDCQYKKYNFASDESIIFENSREASLKLTSVDHELQKISRRFYCHKQCQFESCNQTLVNTKISKTFPSNDSLLLVIETVNKPIMKIKYIPEVDFYNFSTQLASVIAIWLGISFVTFAQLISINSNIDFEIIRSKIKFYSIILKRIILINSRLNNRKVSQINEILLNKKSETVTIKCILIRIMLKLLAFSLFCWQVNNVMTDYFTYKTTVKLNYNMNPRLILPTLSLCIPLRDLMELKITKEVTEDNYFDYFIQQDIKFNSTLEELLDYISTNELIRGCFLRRWKDRFKRIDQINSTEFCLNNFIIEKYFYNRKLCFMIIPNNAKNITYYQSDVRFFLKHPGILFGITSSNRLFPSELHIVVHFMDGIPHDSVEYLVVISNSKSKNMYSFSNGKFNIKLLEAPYDTNCNQHISRNKCFHQCENKKLSKFKKISYKSIEEEILPYKILSFTDLVNETMNNIWTKIENECRTICSQDQCQFAFSLTTLNGRTRSKDINKDEILFVVEVDPFPESEVKVKPMTNLYNMMYQVLCCCSFWLGLSFIGLNPVKIMNESKLKKTEEKLFKTFCKLNYLTNYFLFSCKKINEKHFESGKIFQATIYLTALICLCFHIFHSMKVFLTYSSIIDVYQSFETKNNIDLYLCLDTAELLSRKYNTDLTIESRSKLLSRSISSLINETPKGDEIIRHCSYWGLNDRQKLISQMTNISDRILFTHKNTTVCNEHFTVKKLITPYYMCYGIIPKTYSNWDQIQVKSTLNSQKTLFKISVNNSILTKRYSLLVGRDNITPHTSVTWIPNIIKDPRYINYDISYITYKQSYLPSPYTNDGFIPFVFDKCLNKCMFEKLVKFNLTLSRQFTKPSHLRYLTHLDKKNIIPGNEINKQLRRCEEGCLVYNEFSSSNSSYYLFMQVPLFLATEKATKGQTNYVTTFNLKTTNHPVLLIILRIKIPFIEQLINLGSIVSIWFGFSMIRLSNLEFNDRKINIHHMNQFEKKLFKLKTKYKI